MLWLNKTKRVWRVVIVILLLVAIAGPWWFDRILVPAQYMCSAPNVRLEGDFCGLPVSGTWFPSMAVGVTINVVVELITGKAVLYDRISAFAVNLFLLPVLPIISTLLMILGKYRRHRQVFHIIALGLAVCFALFMSTIRFSSFWWILWGLWLYIGVTVSALVLEALTFNNKTRTRLQI